MDNITNENFHAFYGLFRACEHLEGTSGRLDMIDIISRVLPTLTPEESRSLSGLSWAGFSRTGISKKLGIGPNLLYEAIGYVAGMKKRTGNRENYHHGRCRTCSRGTAFDKIADYLFP